MKEFLIKSFCKINLSLRVIKKINNGMHNIQTLVSFANIFDSISIKEINSRRDKIKFFGKFKSNIHPAKNSVKSTLDILRKYKYLKNQKFSINIQKKCRY